jgi:polysaccharide pyruvyl transferase WcaK-like protein
MKVLVLWADGNSPNLGVRALAQGMESLAKQAWGAATQVDFQDFAPSDVGRSFGGRAVLQDVGRRAGLIKRHLGEYDVILDSGAGDSFTDIYGYKRLLTMAYVQRAAERGGCPIAMGPQTIGPFNTRFGRIVAKRSLQRMALVQARDGVSATHAETLGRPVDTLATDVVFALPPAPQTEAHDIILNVSGLLWAKNGHVDSVQYQASTRRLIKELLDQGRSVSLLAHVIDNPSADNDVPTVRLLKEELGSRVDLLIPTDLADVRVLLASANLVIASRMHASINALSCGTPAIPWAYSRKFAPLLGDIGWDLTVDVKQDPDPVSTTLAILDGHNEDELAIEAGRVVRSAQSRLQSAAGALAGLNAA